MHIHRGPYWDKTFRSRTACSMKLLSIHTKNLHFGSDGPVERSRTHANSKSNGLDQHDRRDADTQGHEWASESCGSEPGGQGIDTSSHLFRRSRVRQAVDFETNARCLELEFNNRNKCHHVAGDEQCPVSASAKHRQFRVFQAENSMSRSRWLVDALKQHPPWADERLVSKNWL